MSTAKTDYGRVRYSATLYLFVLLVIAALGFGSKAYPQSKSTTAALSGTVADPSGARVPNATVKLTNPTNGIARTDTTTQAGEFSFALVVQGNYSLEVSAPVSCGRAPPVR